MLVPALIGKQSRAIVTNELEFTESLHDEDVNSSTWLLSTTRHAILCLTIAAKILVVILALLACKFMALTALDWLLYNLETVDA